MRLGPLARAGLLGAVQGVTEWLPVSSSAHLRLVRELTTAGTVVGERGSEVLAVQRPDARRDQALDAALHLGSAVAAAWVLRADLRRLMPAGLAVLRQRGRACSDEQRLARTVVLAGVPAVLAGGLYAGTVADRLGGRRQVAAVLVGAGVAMWAVDVRAPERTVLATHGRAQVVAVGLGQAAALVPGVSRLGGAYTAARATGTERRSAQRLVLLAGLPLQAGAVVRTLPVLAADRRDRLPVLLTGAVTAAVVGIVTGTTAQRALPSERAGVLCLYRAVVGAALLGAPRLRPALVRPHRTTG